MYSNHGNKRIYVCFLLWYSIFKIVWNVAKISVEKPNYKDQSRISVGGTWEGDMGHLLLQDKSWRSL